MMKRFAAWWTVLCLMVASLPMTLAEGIPATASDITTEAASTDAPKEEETPAESTDVPGDTTPTEEPATDPDDPAEATPVPVTEATVPPAPTVTAAPEQTEEPAASGPAYIVVEGEKRFGSLDELIPLSMETGATIQIVTDTVLRLYGWTTEGIRSVALAPDRTCFPEPELSVIASATSPDGLTQEGVLFIWVGDPEKVTTASQQLGDVLTATEEDVLEREVQVSAVDYTADTACAPTFTLTAIPALEEGQSFGVQCNDEAAQLLTGDTCSPTADGSYRFVILDGAGNILARSAPFALTYAAPTAAQTPAEPAVQVEPQTIADPGVAIVMDSTIISVEGRDDNAPVLLSAELVVTATDYNRGITSDIAPTFTLSGAEADQHYAVSLDGGATVQALNGQVYTAAQEGVYTITFYLLAADGSVVDSKTGYDVDLDFSTASNVRKQAWIYAEDGETRVYGTLSGLLKQASGRTIYILTSDTIVLSGSLSALSGVSLMPDPGVFSVGSVRVWVTTVNPVSAAASDGSVYVYVGAISSAPATGDTVSLTVTPADYAAGAWQNKTPAFALAYTSSLGSSYAWAVRFDGGAPIRLSGSSYTDLPEGKYTLTFVLLDDAGEAVASSEDYPVKLDTTAPLLNVTTPKALTLTVTGGDTLSGVTAVSVNGGSTWYAPDKTAAGVWSLTFTAGSACTFAAGVIRVKDAAGNVTRSTEAVTLTEEKTPSTPTRQGGGGTTTVTHASSDTDTVTAYNGVDLVVNDGTMTTLTVGDTPLELDLVLEDSDRVNKREDYAPAFTAAFTAWNGDETQGVDTLVLTAADSGILDSDYAFSWEFTGTVYKKLAASGIDYLVLKVGDNVTALSTAGFSAGIRYTMYRAEGLASKEFTYRVRMGVPDLSLEMTVTVEGQTYTMTADPTDEFYYYDVLTGSAEEIAAGLEG